MAWCEYCVDRSSWLTTCYKCIKKGKEEDIPDGYVKWYCSDGNTAYSKCPIYNRWYITTMTSNILNIDDNDSTINNLKILKENIQNKEEYNNFMKIYDEVGYIISNRMLYSGDKEEKASKVYSKLEKISELVDNDNIDLAIKRYIMMTLRLVVEYDLKDTYKLTRKKVLKTLDK